MMIRGVLKTVVAIAIVDSSSSTKYTSPSGRQSTTISIVYSIVYLVVV